MNNRKILTLEEVLNLDRRPTLQEMVDLSVEDYTKYLFEKGIIKYIPESGSVEDYEQSDDEKYFPEGDIILCLRSGEIKRDNGGIFECFWDDFDGEDYKLNKSLQNTFEYNQSVCDEVGNKYSYTYKMDPDGDVFYYINTEE